MEIAGSLGRDATLAECEPLWPLETSLELRI